MSTRRGRGNKTPPGPETITTAERSCAISGCDRAYDARGWCSVHYHHGDPMGGLWRLARQQRNREIVAEMRHALAALKEAVGR